MICFSIICSLKAHTCALETHTYALRAQSVGLRSDFLENVGVTYSVIPPACKVGFAKRVNEWIKSQRKVMKRCSGSKKIDSCLLGMRFFVKFVPKWKNNTGTHPNPPKGGTHP